MYLPGADTWRAARHQARLLHDFVVFDAVAIARNHRSGRRDRSAGMPVAVAVTVGFGLGMAPISGSRAASEHFDTPIISGAIIMQIAVSFLFNSPSR